MTKRTIEELKAESAPAVAGEAERQHIRELLGKWYGQGVSLGYNVDGGWWCRRCDAGEAERQADVPHEPTCLWWRTGQALREEEQRSIAATLEPGYALRESFVEFALRLLDEHKALLDRLHQAEALLDLERLAALEHEQWNYWTQAVAPEVSEERRTRWESYWVPYEQLTEEVKEYDRVWARKVREEERHD